MTPMAREHHFFHDLLETHLSGAPMVPSERTALFDHLENCDECRGILEAEQRLTARMKTVPKLMMPQDLRSKIVSQALVDHRERTTTAVSDPVYREILAGNLKPAEDDGQGLPKFAGVTGPKPRPIRQAWRTASPYMSIAFLGVAAAGALYTGDYTGIPGVEQLQHGVRVAVDGLRQGSPLEPQVLVAAEDAPLPEYSSRRPREKVPAPADLGMNPQAEVALAWAAPAVRWLDSLEHRVSIIARAAEDPVPMPAELSEAQIATIVLRPKRKAGNTQDGGFEDSALAEALREASHGNLQAKISGEDQFAYAGHRYRLMTLEMPENNKAEVLRRLTPYRTGFDASVAEAMQVQQRSNAHAVISRMDNTAFFSSEEEALQQAVTNATVGAVTSTKPHRLNIVVVE